MPWMNLAGSMQSQDNINKVGHRKERIKEYNEEYNLLPIDRLTYISVRRWDQQIAVKKKTKFVNSYNQPIYEASRMFILPHEPWKCNIRSVLLYWRQRSSSHSSEGEKSLKRRERPTGHSSRPVSSSCVLPSPHYFTKRVPATGKRYARTLSLSLALTVFLLHTNVAVEEWKYKLYFYISMSPSLFVQQSKYTTLGRPQGSKEFVLIVIYGWLVVASKETVKDKQWMRTAQLWSSISDNKTGYN